MKKMYVFALSTVISLVLSIIYGLYYCFYISDSVMLKKIISIIMSVCQYTGMVVAFIVLIALFFPTLGWFFRFIVWAFKYTFRPKSELPFPRWSMKGWEAFLDGITSM